MYEVTLFIFVLECFCIQSVLRVVVHFTQISDCFPVLVIEGTVYIHRIRSHVVWTVCTKLTERSFHVIGRTCLGIPDQLSFRSSSAKMQYDD